MPVATFNGSQRNQETINHIYWFEDLTIADIALVGGKNASLGEMISKMKQEGVAVPNGFAIGAQLFRDFIQHNKLDDVIKQHMRALTSGESSLSTVGAAIRAQISAGEFTPPQIVQITTAYQQLAQQLDQINPSVAVRSSATAEDLPEASFAGQQESYLNIRGEEELLEACRQCFASLYTDRAIIYRQEQGFEEQAIALSVGVQQMVNALAAGVMFSLDTESGFPDVVVIDGAWGLGETIVKGSVSPDRFMVYKPLLDNAKFQPVIEKKRGNKLVKMVFSDPSQDPALTTSTVTEPTVTVPTEPAEQIALVLTDAEVLALARWAVKIERHYQRPMDMEWVKDSISHKLYIVQARPETVESQKDSALLVNYRLKEHSAVLLEGASVGSAIATGPVFKISSPADIDQFPPGAILVTEKTDPDWVPLMRKSSGIITDLGGPTSHAAIVSRELKVAAIVGCDCATTVLSNCQQVTISCAEGSIGKVYEGKLAYETTGVNLADIPHTKTDIMINAALPDDVFHWWPLPIAGIGLTRIEFIISSQIRIHPMALVHPERVLDREVMGKIAQLTQGFQNLSDYFIENLALGVAKIAASQYPKPVTIRMSDFKSNEYRALLGGEFFELEEENPMLGLRGASRYYHERYREAFLLECKAIIKARQQMGLTNIIVMIPFCRTPKEADQVLEVMAEAGLKPGVDGLQVYVMCEIPSNIILAEEFAQRFDGFSIGSNDLTQLVLGIDRDSAELKPLFDARNDAVKAMISQVIKVAHEHGCKVGICGQAPSDHPEFAEFLVNCGIDSISLNPDSVATTSVHIAKAERAITIRK